MKIIDKFFRDKKQNTVIYILLAAGIILVLLGSVGEKKPEEPKEAIKNEGIIEETLKDELEKTLSQIKGAGIVTVMLTYENDGEKKFGYDVLGKDKKTVILNKQGSQEALVSSHEHPYVRGVIIIADGGGNIKVRESLIKATQTVLSLAPHKIEVFERNEGYDDGD